MATPIFNYSYTQQLYCLNAASNAVGGKIGTTVVLQECMQKMLEVALPCLNSDWEVVWGPAVLKENDNNADTGPVNAWYVAKSESAKAYVVAIAGTAVTSLKAWAEDFNIRQVVDFNKWTSQWTATSVPTPEYLTYNPLEPPTTVFAAGGTSYSSHNVLNMPSPPNARSPNLLLGDFLSQNTEGYQIVFTGHSMGGAVAPTVALGLQQAGLLRGAAGVVTLPSAGATPGNAAFAAAFASIFPAAGPFNTDLFNTLDIVPQAFGTDLTADRNLANILQIYNNNIVREPARAIVKGLYDWVNDIYVQHSMPYVPLPGTPFTPSPGIVAPVVWPKQLVQSIGHQHTAEYWAYLGITDCVRYFDDLMKKMGLSDVAPLLEEKAEDDLAALAALTTTTTEPVAAESKAADVTVEEVPAHVAGM